MLGLKLHFIMEKFLGSQNIELCCDVEAHRLNAMWETPDYLVYGWGVVFVGSKAATLPQSALDPVGEAHVFHEVIVMDTHIPLGILIEVLISDDINSLSWEEFKVKWK